MVKTKLVPIGNSKGIRLPKVIIEQCHLNETVELSIQKDGLLISPIHEPRAGWEKSFKQMAESKDDELLDMPDGSTEWDREEWKWE